MSSRQFRVRPGGAGLALTAAAVLTAAPTAASAAEEFAQIKRPPQFVVISFDNGRELRKWRELRLWARDLERRGKPAKFTFFVSAANFLSYAERRRYKPPRLRAGRSNIGFGGTAVDVRDRVSAINAIIADGHEFGSHAVGHFRGGKGRCFKGAGVTCGANWTLNEWLYEHRVFEQLMADVARNLGAADEAVATIETNKPTFDPVLHRDMIGFRAPHLSINAAMFDGLKRRGFRYDASWATGAAIDAWPVRHATGLWLFKLPRLSAKTMVGRPARGRTLAMDYNFCARDTARHGHTCIRINRSAQNRDRFGRQMLATYLAYFRQIFAGNRAPIHIGHHFSEFQAGTYHRALIAFVEAVCGQPEVRCVTYRELTRYMDRLSDGERRALQAGQFVKRPAPRFDLDAVWKSGQPSAQTVPLPVRRFGAARPTRPSPG